jgi:hypothetical protein
VVSAECANPAGSAPPNGELGTVVCSLNDPYNN